MLRLKFKSPCVSSSDYSKTLALVLFFLSIIFLATVTMSSLVPNHYVLSQHSEHIVGKVTKVLMTRVLYVVWPSVVCLHSAVSMEGKLQDNCLQNVI